MIFKSIKFLISIICFVFSLFITFIVIDTGKDLQLLGLAGFLVLLAAALWIDFTKASDALGLLLTTIFIGLLILAINTALGNVSYPIKCTSGRFSILCVLENSLYTTGGNLLASTLWFLFAFMAFRGALITFKRTSRTPQ